MNQESARVTVITLKPTHTEKKERKKVVWTEDTVDNEHMNKKKSKCCCIYEKPRAFGESDSEESDDECEHCFGHVERRRAHAHAEPAHTDTQTQDSSEATASATLEPDTPAPVPQPPPSPPCPPDH